MQTYWYLYFQTRVIVWSLIFARRIYLLFWRWCQTFFYLYCAFVQNVGCWQKIAADGGLCLKIAVRRSTAHPSCIMPLNCTRRVRIRNFSQGRIKLFGAPRQWKHFRPLFQAVFLSGGGINPPQTESNTTPPSPKTEITNILFYILNFASIIKFKM